MCGNKSAAGLGCGFDLGRGAMVRNWYGFRVKGGRLSI